MARCWWLTTTALCLWLISGFLMSKVASQNEFPHVLLVEGSTPTTPASGNHALYVASADDLLKHVDSSGAVRHAGLMQRSVTTLTDAQIKALPGTPITLVAAPGSGYRIKVHGATATLTATAGAYTGIDAAYASIELTLGGKWMGLPLINDNTLTTPLAQVSGFLGSAQTKVWDIQIPYLDAVEGGGAAGAGQYLKYLSNSGMPTVAQIDNVALLLAAENGASFTGGNAANTLKVSVYWSPEAL